MLLRLVLVYVVWCIGCSPVVGQEVKKNPAWAGTYDDVRLSDGVFIVSSHKKMAIATPNGKLLTQFLYDTIYNFREGIAIVGQGYREVNQFGKVLADFKYGYLDKAGHLIVPIQYEHINSFSEGLGLIEGVEGYDSGDRAGYMFVNKAGYMVLNPKAAYVCQPFQGGTAYVEVPKQGFWLAPYDDGRNNGSHKQLYDIAGKTIYGNYIDHKGRLLIPQDYDTIAPYIPGYLRPARKDGKWGFLDSSATLRIALQYTDIDEDSAFFWQDLRRVGIGGQFGFINTRTGKLSVPLLYQASRPSRSDLVWVRRANRWGCLDKIGNLRVLFDYTDAQPFERGVAAVEKAGKWGLVNASGKLLTEIKYDEIGLFQESRAVFKEKDKFGFLDLKGQEVIPAVYSQVSAFEGGHAYATLSGLFITLDQSGSWVKVKLQLVTLKLLAVVIGSLLVLWFVWRKKRAAIHNPSL